MEMGVELIQIIEDDPDLARLLELALRKARYRTNVAHDGEVGLQDIKRLNPSLILLDVMLPGTDGHEICRLLREDHATQATPIIMVTALGSEGHRVTGLELGADDYITKPFSLHEVVARVRAVLRRGQVLARPVTIPLEGGLVLEDCCFVVSFRGKSLTLSGPERQILGQLARLVGQVVTQEELVALLWGEDGLMHEHELARHVQALKQKLENQYAGLIETLPGVGYRLTSRRH